MSGFFSFLLFLLYCYIAMWKYVAMISWVCTLTSSAFVSGVQNKLGGGLLGQSYLFWGRVR